MGVPPVSRAEFLCRPVGEVALNSDAIEDLLARGETEAENAPTLDVVIVKGEETLAETEEMTEEQKETLRAGNTREVFDISVYAGGKRLEDFKTETGKLTVGLPCELKPGETGEGVWVRHVAEDGSSEPMVDGRRYDEKKKLAVFQTSHLSIYAVVYEKETKTEDTGENAGRGSGGCDAGFGAAERIFGLSGWVIFSLAAVMAVKRGGARNDRPRN
ncbi:MAG: hypothetical protein LBO82_04405 [Synergistaceae bacterium]|jgi:hypothetical protein|nr:hypothetical protein [Synergistaceae bacterium]